VLLEFLDLGLVRLFELRRAEKIVVHHVRIVSRNVVLASDKILDVFGGMLPISRIPNKDSVDGIL